MFLSGLNASKSKINEIKNIYDILHYVILIFVKI
jgi:hypothetical protein